MNAVSERPAAALRRRQSIAPAHRKARQPEHATFFTEVDLEASGKQVGVVHFPHSPHDDAWGTVPVPLAVIANGDGPTVLLEGGNHGDEYEGPIALGELLRAIQLHHVRGRLIFIPAINRPAVVAGRRTSPLDDKNMNRSFPGDHGGSVTEQIAAYVNDELIPRADGLVSLHSGGSSLRIVPSTIVLPSPDAQQFERGLAAARAFAAPMCVVMDTLGDRRLCVASAQAAGLVCVSTEMAGGGGVTPAALRLCREGVRRVLRTWGVLQDGVVPDEPPAQQYYDMQGAGAYVIASDAGVFEPVVELGHSVRRGDLAGRIHFLASPSKEPIALFFGDSGTVYGIRQPGIVRPGSACAVVARPRLGPLV